MSTDKENPKNGDMEVEDGSSEETPDTPESKSVIETKDSEDSSAKAKEKDSIKKKTKGKEVKKEEVSNDSKTEKEEKEDSESDEDDNDDDDDEEDDDGKVPLLDQPLEMSGTRERKKVQRFTEEYKTEVKDKTPIEIPEGKGMALGNIGKIEANIQKMKADEIKPLHKLLFNRTGKSTLVKKFVRKFNGFDFDEKSEQYTKKKQVLLKLELKVLKSICTILALKKSSKREELAEQILNFLMKPEGSDKPDKPVKQQRKRGSRTNKSYSESDEEEKRPQSRRGKMKRVNLKEVSTDEEDFDDQKEDKGSGDENNEVSKRERKSKDSDKDTKENDDDEENENEEENEEEEEASSDDSEEPKSKRGKGSRSGKKNNKVPAKKANSKKPAPKKVEKKPAPKKRAKSEDEEDESSEDEPIIKKTKTPPTDEEIKTYVKHILEGANLEETTMKIVCRKVYAHYPDFDLAHKKDFIKTTVKSLIST